MLGQPHLVPSGPIRSITTSPEKSCWIPGLPAVPGSRTSMSLMRPRSATNSVELTPVALSSGIVSGNPLRVVVERRAELAGRQASAIRCVSATGPVVAMSSVAGTSTPHTDAFASSASNGEALAPVAPAARLG